MKGHFATLWTHARDRALRPPSPPGVTWSGQVPDPRLGTVALSGVLGPSPNADTLAVIIHGLGGSAESNYCRRAAAAARRIGMASLRVSLRGADGSGEGLYHAGLTHDLEAAIASPEAAEYEHIVVAGFSLGGHIALRLGTAPPPRVRAVAAVCSPIDLDASCRALDSPRRALYRRHFLRGLHAHYERLARRGDVPVPPREARRIWRVRDWDDAIVAPWFGFESAAAYYARESVGPRLSQLAVPTLAVVSKDDPVIDPDTVRTAVRAGESPHLTAIESRGGHVGFHPKQTFGLPGPPGVHGQVLGWLASQLGGAARGQRPLAGES